MNYNIQNAASKIADPTRTTLEEAFEQGAQWMKYEICDILYDIKTEIDNILYGVENGHYNGIKNELQSVSDEINEIIN